MVSLRSFLEAVSWVKVLAGLGVRPTAASLPTTAECPVCRQGRLEIFDSRPFNWQWAYCRHCAFAGDMLQLASAAWQLDVESVITRLNEQGHALPTHRSFLAAHKQHVVANQTMTAELWQHAKLGLIHHNTGLSDLIHKLSWRSELPASWADQGLSQLVGHVDADYLRNMLERSDGAATNKRQSNVLPGTNWSSVLVLPMYDLPGRICRFLFIGRDASSKDYVWHSTLSSVASSTESGLHFCPDIRRSSLDWDKSAVVINSIVDGMPLHIRQLEQSARGLPLILCDTGYTQRGHAVHPIYSWQMFTNRTLIFWCNRLTADIVAHAARSNGKIIISQQVDDRATFLRHQEPNNFLLSCRRNAVPWAQAVATYCREVGVDEQEELLVDLPKFGVDPNIVIAQSRLVRTARSLPTTYWVTSSGRTRKGQLISATGDYWCLHSGHAQEMLIDADLVLDKAITKPSTGELYYTGHIGYYGKRVPFCAPKRLLAGNTLDWMQQCLVQARLGVPQCHPQLSHQLFHMAVGLRNPVCVRGNDTVGWNSELAGIVFPTFCLSRAGTTQAVNFLPDENTPCMDFSQPAGLTASDAYALTRPCGPLVYAMLLAVLRNILAPIYNYAPSNICICGPSSWAAIELAAGLGCPAVSGKQLSSWPHNWPAIRDLRSADNTSVLRKLIHNTGRTVNNCITIGRPLTALASVFTDRWIAITEYNSIDLPASAIAAARALLVNYLADLARRSFRREDDRYLGRYQELAKDLRSYLVNTGVDTTALSAGLNRVLTESVADKATVIGSIVAQAVINKQLPLITEGYSRSSKLALLKQPSGAVIGKPPSIKLTRAAWNRCIGKEPIDPRMFDQIPTMLDRAGRLHDAGHNYVCFSSRWLSNLIAEASRPN